MTDRDVQRIEEEAIAWVVRLRDAGADDWEAFTGWLEADAAHQHAYDEAALADLDAADLAPAPRPVQPAWTPAEAPAYRPNRRRFLGWGGGAVAAAVAGLVAYTTIPAGAALYAVETGPGEHRRIDLADGSRIDLNGGTRIQLDRNNARFASLEQGEALFTVVHDEARPFEVEAAGAQMRDLGTVFNVVAERGAVEVGVSEGRVLFDPRGVAVDLSPGMSLRRAAATARPVVARVEPDAIGGWRAGRLSYRSASVAQVASDLSRNLGVAVRASPPVARQNFTGVIMLDADKGTAVRRAASLLGVSASRAGDGWLLTVGSSGTP
ncbi:MAG TPA: FecR domain-containing protein [Allosphingosinicella sp.]|nr:FecR domain-containing protein [Allosphingosinicella sp.]